MIWSSYTVYRWKVPSFIPPWSLHRYGSANTWPETEFEGCQSMLSLSLSPSLPPSLPLSLSPSHTCCYLFTTVGHKMLTQCYSRVHDVNLKTLTQHCIVAETEGCAGAQCTTASKWPYLLCFACAIPALPCLATIAGVVYSLVPRLLALNIKSLGMRLRNGTAACL